MGLFTAAALANGTYNLRITYPGDANYNPINEPLSISVVSNNLLVSTTTATESAASTSSKAAVTIAATVTGQSGHAMPTGSVSLLTSNYVVAKVNLAPGSGASSIASLVVDGSRLLPGANAITVAYSGDGVYQPSSTTLSVTNGLGPGVAGFAISATSVAISEPGGSATSNLVVAPSNGFTGNVVLTCAVINPPGTVDPPTCSAASASVVGAPSVNTTLTISTTSSTPTATYTLQITGTSGSVTATTNASVLVTAAPVAGFTLAGSPINISSPGMSGTSSITITPTNAFTGSVGLTCVVSSTVPGTLPTCSVSAPPAITGTAAVAATLTVATASTTADGSYTVTITGTSGTITETTTALVTVSGTAIVPNFALSGTAITNVTPGQPATSSITVTPSGGFTGTVALGCAITSSPTGVHDAPTCTVAAPAAITGSDAVTATLTISTTAPSVAGMHDPFHNLFAIGGGTALAGMFFFFLPRRRKSWKALTLMIVALTVAGSATGCGSKQTQSAPGDGGTTAGAYTFTVTGTSGSLTQTATVSVVVK